MVSLTAVILSERVIRLIQLKRSDSCLTKTCDVTAVSMLQKQFFCAENSFWRLSNISTGKVHPKNNNLLGDTLLHSSYKNESAISMVARWAVLKKSSYNVWAQKSFWRMAIISTRSLLPKKYQFLLKQIFKKTKTRIL
jgi:hypothetical protein